MPEAVRPHGEATSRGTRPEPQQERAKATRRALVRTAARLWGERGFDDVTVEEICSAAGVGRTTFYLHFASKEELLSGLAAGTAAGVEEALVASWGRPLEERLAAFIDGVARRMEGVPKSLAALVIHSQRLFLMRAGASGREEGFVRFADLLRAVLAEARERGELGATADVAELGEMLGALTMDAIDAWAAIPDADLARTLRFRFDVVLAQFTLRHRT